MSAERIDEYAAQGVTRIVVNTTTIDPAEQRDQMSKFAEEHGLTIGQSEVDSRSTRPSAR
jgi:hypothetical protein